MSFDRDDLPLLVSHRPLRGSEHQCHAGPVEIAVTEPDIQPLGGQSSSQIRRDGRFTHPTLATRNRDDVLYSWNAYRPLGAGLDRSLHIDKHLHGRLSGKVTQGLGDPCAQFGGDTRVAGGDDKLHGDLIPERHPSNDAKGDDVAGKTGIGNLGKQGFDLLLIDR